MDCMSTFLLLSCFGGRSRGDDHACRQAVAAQFADDLAARKDQRAMADMGDLLEIGGDDDDGETGFERS
jgi:hypothetical protein